MSNTGPQRILTVDDNQAIHEDYRKVLVPEPEDLDFAEDEAFLFGESTPAVVRATYEVDSATQGEQAIEMVKQAIAENRPYCSAFVDVRMPPGIDGVETAARIWEIEPDLPIVLCTAYSDHTWEEIFATLGHSDQLLILKKPFDNIELRQMVASQTCKYHTTKLANLKMEQLEAMVEKRSEEITITRDVMFFILARLAESRDKETGEHLERITRITRILANWLSKNGPYQRSVSERFAIELERSSVLHDIGKVGIPDQVLLKPAQLTSDEFEVMKQHVDIGADALDEAAKLANNCDFLRIAAEIARYHHERYDGLGYPAGLAGDRIPLSARIVAVADVYDALTSVRVYKTAIPAQEACDYINSQSGQHFDPAVVEAFNACRDSILKVTNPQGLTSIQLV